MRRGFGLIQALIVIILISGIMMIAMKYARVSTKQTSDMYAKESAELFMDSAVELALLSISGYARSANNCLKEVHITSMDKRYIADVNITAYYLMQSSVDCTTYCTQQCIAIQTEESHGMALLEVVVETNQSHPKNHDKQIRLTRRTLQRP